MHLEVTWANQGSRVFTSTINAFQCDSQGDGQSFTLGLGGGKHVTGKEEKKYEGVMFFCCVENARQSQQNSLKSLNDWLSDHWWASSTHWDCQYCQWTLSLTRLPTWFSQLFSMRHFKSLTFLSTSSRGQRPKKKINQNSTKLHKGYLKNQNKRRGLLRHMTRSPR